MSTTAATASQLAAPPMAAGVAVTVPPASAASFEAANAGTYAAAPTPEQFKDAEEYDGEVQPYEESMHVYQNAAPAQYQNSEQYQAATEP